MVKDRALTHRLSRKIIHSGIHVRERSTVRSRGKYLPPNVTMPTSTKPGNSKNSCQDDVEWVHRVSNAPDVTCENYASNKLQIGFCYEDHFEPLPWEPQYVIDTTGE
jgi:hypothetical protein